MSLSSAHSFTELVAGILAENENIPLTLARSGTCNREKARLLISAGAADLFPEGRHPEAALSGLLLRLGCWDKSHGVSQDIPSPEGSYWHGIAHRMEPDSANAAYWFQRVGNHPTFEPLQRRAAEILQRQQPVVWNLKPAWDPFLFLQWCDEARNEASELKDRIAREIQMAEWELLFQWCALGRGMSK